MTQVQVAVANRKQNSVGFVNLKLARVRLKIKSRRLVAVK